MSQSKAQILYVEDDMPLSYVTKDNLELLGYTIEICNNGQEALDCFEQNTFDLCILDVMLPKIDGFTLARKIRKKNHDIPILFVTAKSTQDDKLLGLQIGGDDYITKPFSIEELALKIEIFLKRNKISNLNNNSTIVTLGKYTIDFEDHELKTAESHRKLTYRETELLRLFYTNQNRVLKREDILKPLWGDDDYFKGRSLDVFISRLRKYLKDDPNLKIENIHNLGFKLKVIS